MDVESNRPLTKLHLTVLHQIIGMSVDIHKISTDPVVVAVINVYCKCIPSCKHRFRFGDLHCYDRDSV